MALSRPAAMKIGVVVFLLVVCVLGFFNSSDVAKTLMPESFWGTREYWIHRQQVYAERSVTAVDATIDFLGEILDDPETMEKMGLHDGPTSFALRKETARLYRAKEKLEYLTYELARIRNNLQEAKGEARQ